MYTGNGYTFSETFDFFDETINETKEISLYISTKPFCYNIDCENKPFKDVVNEVTFGVHCSIDFSGSNYPNIQENHFKRDVLGLKGLEAMHDMLKYQLDFYGKGYLADKWFTETLRQFEDRHVFEGGLKSEDDFEKVVSW